MFSTHKTDRHDITEILLKLAFFINIESLAHYKCKMIIALTICRYVIHVCDAKYNLSVRMRVHRWACFSTLTRTKESFLSSMNGVCFCLLMYYFYSGIVIYSCGTVALLAIYVYDAIYQNKVIRFRVYVKCMLQWTARVIEIKVRRLVLVVM
jgi:hypothetical protein